MRKQTLPLSGGKGPESSSKEFRLSAKRRCLVHPGQRRQDRHGCCLRPAAGNIISVTPENAVLDDCKRMEKMDTPSTLSMSGVADHCVAKDVHDRRVACDSSAHRICFVGDH